MYDVILRGGTVVNADSEIAADVAIDAATIVAVEPQIAETARTEIDATGLHLFPGLIDPHVHFNEPGRSKWEGFATGSRALAAAGVTTFFDMPLNSHPPLTTAVAYQHKRAAADEKSIVNCYLWGGLIPGNLHEVEALHQYGVIGFKAFMSNSGIPEFPAVDDFTLCEGMKIIAGLGGIVAVHAENDSITHGLAQAALQAGKVSAADYLNSRPVVAELEAIQRAILFAEETGCRLYIVHVSTGRGIALIQEAIARGITVTAETCPHYLVLSEEDVLRLGAAAKCAPPLRPPTEQKQLWEHLLAGHIHVVASDHSPSSPELKQGDNFFQIWGGISGCQSTLSLLLTAGYYRRGMTLEQIAAVTSYNPAEQFGLERKGRIAVGADADIALVDVNAAYTLQAADLFYRHKISPYIGMALRGKVMRTIVGGKTVYLNGAFVDG